jgi:hypothetical protein
MIVRYSLERLKHAIDTEFRLRRPQRAVGRYCAPTLRRPALAAPTPQMRYQAPAPPVRVDPPTPPRSARDKFIADEIERNSRAGRYRRYAEIAADYDRMSQVANAAAVAAAPQ